jgi:exo-1,4-beta-D-glucosaminidase
VYTPQAEFGDLTGLNTLPQVKLEVTSAKEEVAGKAGIRASLGNPSGSVAFMVHLRVTTGKSGENVAPTLWSDNYFSLLPGEQKEVHASYDSTDLGGKDAVLEIDGYNVSAQSTEPK